MYTIIKNIPHNAGIDQIHDLANPMLKAGLFQKEGKILAIKILERVFRDHSNKERYALVRVCSESARKRLIKCINKLNIQYPVITEDVVFKKVTASEFKVRHHSNDRRMLSKSAVEKRGNERRILGSKMLTLSEKSYENQPLTSKNYKSMQQRPAYENVFQNI